MRFDDPPTLPGTGEPPADCFARAVPPTAGPAVAYLARRGIPLAIAEAADVRFCADYAGRPALLAAVRGQDGALLAVHGRYLHAVRGQDKMLTVGIGGGAVGIPDSAPLVVVEGLFDALSLATCGRPALATIGRWAPWLPQVAEGRDVWLAMDATHPGEAEVQRYTARLAGARCRRLAPPPRCKDWNTALVKRGPAALERWLCAHLEQT